MSTAPASPAPAPAPVAYDPQPRSLSAGYGGSWWSEGWRVFAAAPGTWIGLVLIFLACMFALLLVPLLGSIAQTLLLPVFAGGMMLGCHALARGEPLRIAHLFEGFNGGRFGPLLIIGLVMLAAWFALAIVLGVVAFATIGLAGLGTLAQLTDPTRIDLGALIALGYAFLAVALVALVGGMLIGMAYWFAPALVVLHGEEPLRAMRKSFAASWRNLGAFAIYGLLYIVLAILATIPFGLGWLVLAPVIAGSGYASWRTTFA